VLRPVETLIVDGLGVIADGDGNLKPTNGAAFVDLLGKTPILGVQIFGVHHPGKIR